jgi:hypothetical protein
LWCHIDVIAPTKRHIGFGDLKKLISECAFPLGDGCMMESLVDVNATITEGMVIISEEVVNECSSTGTSRIGPLVISSMPRGGKTTILKLLMNKCKQKGYNAIFLNGNGPFKRGIDESHLDSILRLIATQLIDLPADDITNTNKNDELLSYIQCDQAALTKYINEKCDNTATVLLIDELNRITGGGPLQANASAYLKSEWLDKKNRFLVFTTHIPLAVTYTPSNAFKYVDASVTASNSNNTADVVTSSMLNKEKVEPRLVDFLEPNRDSSKRSFHVISHMPCSTNISSLQQMKHMVEDVKCNGVTPAEAALYGGVPALIYAVKHENFNPNTRVLQESVKIQPSQKMEQLKLFIFALLDGNLLFIQDLCCQLFMFSTMVQNKSTKVTEVRWSPVYIGCILNLFDDIRSLNLYSLINTELAVLASTTEGGKEWEKIVECAIVLQCLNAKYNQGCGPFNIVQNGNLDLTVSRISLKSETKTLDQAKTEIDCFIMENIITENSVTVISIPYGKFPDYDLFVVTRSKKRMPDSSPKTVIYAIQNKTGRALPKHDVPDWIDKGYLVRGKAPATTYSNQKWTYLERKDVEQLLGCSLRVLYPDNWAEVSLVDDFD